ncbi:MAG TPA: type I 3-dehydroquinate dehydratase [Planctomycetota bacterium]|nr:type I 3-dehydroquinate dehydratase [Planctomycetota bacterium]
MTADPVRTRVVGIVAERTRALAREEAARAAPLCDLLEFRLDWLEEPADPAALLADLPLPAIASCRIPSEGGGRWAGTEEARRDLLAAAGRAGAAWIDVEAGVAPPADRGRAELLRSLHLASDSEETPAAALARLDREEGALLKFVVHAPDAPRGLEALALLKARAAGARPLASFATGPAAMATRVLQPVFGGALVYAASRRCREPVPDIPILRELEEVYGVRNLGRATAFFPLLGRPLRHSVSPPMVNAALRAAGKDAVYLPVPCDDAEKTARALVGLGAAGLAFTAPHKAVPLWMASLTEAVAAHSITANTLFRQGKLLVAANTDGPAARRLAREALGSLDGKTALVLGTGGTARAVAAALREERCRVHLLGRNPDKTAAAAATTGAYPGLPGTPTVDLLVQATPVGQWPAAPRDLAATLCPGLGSKLRFDTVYNPRATAFLAGAAGAKTIRGVDMLAAQAADQLRMFGVPKPESDLMLRTAEAALDRMELRVLLLGMRGSGKSAVAAALAASTGRPLLDTDRMVEEQARKTVAQIFASFGEDAFRVMEKEAVARALRPSGTVVAFGGGAALHLAERPAGAEVVWVRARRDTLVARVRASDRPSLRGRPVEEEIDILMAEREALYARLATRTVETDDRTPGEAAAEIAEALGI